MRQSDIRKIVDTKLFIPNNENNQCAVITSYQFMILSGMNYKEFKRMVKEIPATKYDTKILKFLEPELSSNWGQDLMCFLPEPKAFKFTLEVGQVKWNHRGYIKDVHGAYSYFDLFCSFLFRFMTGIDLVDIKMTTKEILPILKGKTEFPIKMRNTNIKRISKYCNYMTKFTRAIPLLAYEFIYTKDADNIEYNQHVFMVVKYGPGYYVEMNSNHAVKKVHCYNMVDLLDFEKRPPHRKIVLKSV